MLGGGILVGAILIRAVGFRTIGLTIQATGIGLIILALALRTLEHLRSGTAYARGKYYVRAQQPEVYWLIVVTFIVAIGILTWHMSTLLRPVIAGRQ
jgi:hypothetical protein